MQELPSPRKRTLLVALLVYSAATLIHHVHNAELLDQYPHMPAWLSPLGVYAAWLAATTVGLAGYLSFRRGHRRIGLGLLVLYACYGMDSLGHYALAPMVAHTSAMHLTIWLEVLAAAGLLVTCGIALRSANRRE
jgi:hypothetical protein